jgi:toxin-antitoxin system PIN domain toxin
VTVLLDSNVLIALVVAEHVHHAAAEDWFAATITQASLVRLVLRESQPASVAIGALTVLVDHPRHEFWPDDIGYAEVRLDGVMGHRQVADAYLAQLARHRQGRLASFDEGLAALHDDVAELVPTR